MTKLRDSLSSEIAQLEDILARVPEQRVIHRSGLLRRLASAREALQTLGDEDRSHTALLTFRGEPVIGNTGIYASFAGKAAHAFSETVATFAEGLAGRLSAMAGPIAGGDRSRLLITGTATGSFGFEFKVPVEEQDPDHGALPGMEIAIAKIQELFEEARRGDSEDLADIVAEVHPRSVKKAREFLDILREHGAWCSLSYGDKPFAFDDLAEVQQTCILLGDDNISESDEAFVGVMDGMLPTARQIELRIADEDLPLRVRIGKDIEDVEALKRFLDKRMRATLRVTRVAGRRPRYELITPPSLVDPS